MTEPLSRTPAEATQELVYPQILDEAARHCSHLPAFTDQHQALCICAVRERADRVASALDELVPTDAPFAVLACPRTARRSRAVRTPARAGVSGRRGGARRGGSAGG